MSRRALAGIGLSIVVALSGVAFALLFAADATDDYAGWVPTAVGLGLPAALVILRERAPLGRVGALTMALPGGLAFAGLFASGALVLPFGELVQVVALVGLAPLIAVIVAIALWRLAHPLATREAAARVLALVVAAALADLLLLAPRWWGFWRLDGLDQGLAVAALLLAGAPLLWALAPGVVWLALARPRVPERRA